MVSAAAATGAAPDAAAVPSSSSSVVAKVASLEIYSIALSVFNSLWRSVLSDATRIDSALSSRLDGFSRLELHCAAMDGPGLRAHLAEHRDELRDPARALDAALLVAPDPGLLVLAAAAGFCRVSPGEDETVSDAKAKVSCRLLVDLLDRLRVLGVKPSPEARDEARAVAADWKRGNRIGAQAVFKKETIAFLLLVGVFGLVEDVGGVQEVVDLLVSVSGRERAVDVLVALGLNIDQHLPVLIQTMIKKGKQLEAVKFIQALNLVHKYPILPVLRSYINDAAKAGSMIRIRGDNSALQNEADAKERTLLGTLQKFIKEQKLEEFPILEEVNKRMAQLEKQSAERKRAVSAAAAAACEASEKIRKQQLQQQQLLLQTAKRPKLAENVVQGSLGQNISSVDTLSQQVMSRQSAHTAGVYQVASSQSIRPAFTQNAQRIAGSQSPVGIQNQAPVAPSIHTQYGSLPDYYGLIRFAPVRSSMLDPQAPGPSRPNVPGAYTSSRSKLYTADPIAAVSQPSDKKSSSKGSYTYSLSSMSTYNP